MFSHRFVFRAVGSLLLIAAGLKAYGLAVDPISPIGVFSLPAVQSAIVLLEIAAALWLLWGGRPIGAWLTALVLFTVFAAVSLYQGMIGQASCGCFGRLAVSPWYAFGLDVMILAALLAGRPNLDALRSAALVALPRLLRPVLIGSVGVAGLLALFAGLATVGFGSPGAALAYFRGEAVAVSPRVLDLGAVPPGPGQRATIELTNWSAEPVRIFGGTVDCSCDITESLPVTIPAGETRPLTLTFRLPASPGLFSRKALLMTDCPTARLLAVRVVGRITEPREDGSEPPQ